MDKDVRSRKWQLTFNNPLEHGFSHDVIKSGLSKLKGVVYWCMCDEVGEQGTPHSHVYVHSSDAIRFSTLKKLFGGAHFELAKGTAAQNRDYVFKLGKWKPDKKAETNVASSQEESGEVPLERPGTRTDLADLYDLIKEGIKLEDILEQYPQYMTMQDSIVKTQNVVLWNNFKNTFRNLEVVYIYGDSGTGKTRFVMERFGYDNVYRVTDYDHPFDRYSGHDVILFEEFRSSLKIQDMLNYLDGYPLELPARYSNRTACYTKVFILTNIPLDSQYPFIRESMPETWKAFLRRIHKVEHYDTFEIKKFSSVLEYMNRWEIIQEDLGVFC